MPKLISGDILGDDERLVAHLLTLGDEIERQQAKLDRGREQRSCRTLHDLGNRKLQLQREWLDDVERELRG